MRAQCRHPVWGDYASAVLSARPSPPKGGVDAGDHPPITPVAAATEEELGGGDAWRLYDFVARWFLGSVSPDCLVRRSRASLAAGGESFSASGLVVLRPGFAAVMPWRAPQPEPLPPLEEGEALPLQGVELVAGRTSPPDHLTESELIERMERHGIGTGGRERQIEREREGDRGLRRCFGRFWGFNPLATDPSIHPSIHPPTTNHNRKHRNHHHNNTPKHLPTTTYPTQPKTRRRLHPHPHQQRRGEGVRARRVGEEGRPH